jgi:aspartate/methionine/tyrosine aminotransferase
MSGSALTSFQEHASAAIYDDFTVGYPRLMADSEQWQRFRELAVRANCSEESRADSVEALKTSVRTLLGTPSQLDCEVTFSGSIALERTISAVIPPERNTLVTVPGFDSIISFVERAASHKPVYLKLDAFSPRDKAVESLLDRIDNSFGAVIIVSPNNPTGLTLSSSELGMVAEACAAIDAVLIVDHCFLMVNRPAYAVGTAFELEEKCRWVALWDSSKTVELLGERFGFIFGSDHDLSQIKVLLNEIQFELPVASLRVMNEALQDLIVSDELQVRDKLIWQNYLDLQRACRGSGFRINLPDGGGFALIGVEGMLEADSMSVASRLLREQRIAVTPSKVLYPPDISADREFIRVSLVRPREMVAKLCVALQTMAGVYR